jgi:hypothetical protein
MKSFFIKTNIKNNLPINFKYIIKPKLKSINNITVDCVINELRNIGLEFKQPKAFYHINEYNIENNDYRLKRFVNSYLLLFKINEIKYIAFEK